MTAHSYNHRRARLALRSVRKEGEPDGAWWPRSRDLSAELPDLFASWPTESVRIGRVLYSPPDWDDRPHSVSIPGRAGQVSTASFASDNTHMLILTILDGTRRVLEVIPSETPADRAHERLDAFAD